MDHTWGLKEAPLVKTVRKKAKSASDLQTVFLMLVARLALVFCGNLPDSPSLVDGNKRRARTSTRGEKLLGIE
jgi:hypothetical protein